MHILRIFQNAGRVEIDVVARIAAAILDSPQLTAVCIPK
jgi:hypothetical protein